MKKSQTDKPTVIFIAGTSRSGSTLLDLLLGSNPQCVSVGEMHQLQGFALQDFARTGFRDPQYPLVCTCGKPVCECEFWSAVENAADFTLKDTSFKSQASPFWKKIVQLSYLLGGPHLLRTLKRWFPTVQREVGIADNCFRIYDAIAQISGATYIIDSSKDIYQYLLLKTRYPSRVKLITLYRDGRAVAFSQTRGRRRELWNQDSKDSPFVQATKRWVRVNRNIRLFASWTPASDKFSLRYEDLCRNPKEILNNLFRELHISAPPSSPQINKNNRHNIGGSPSRLDPSLTRIQLDERWKEALSADQLRDFERIAGRLNKRLGYQ